MKRVYLASPYTIGNKKKNVKRQLDAANELMDLNYVPYVPLLSHFQHIVHPRPDEDWLHIGKEWVKVCHAVLRLPGESKGADAEVALAHYCGIPVFYSIKELKEGL